MEEQLSNKIYRQIQHDILARTIDERMILTENELVQKYGVSKAPVREALHLLCAQGYLISYPRKGYLIRVYSRAEIRKIQQLRAHIEKLSVILAIQNASDEEILSLREYLTQQDPQADPDKANNTLFHMRLAELSGNEYIPETLRGLIHKICLIWIEQEFDIASHAAIMNALLERDTEKALLALEKDLNQGITG